VSARLTRTLSQTDIEVLALVSGDVDPFSCQIERGKGCCARRVVTVGIRLWRRDLTSREPSTRHRVECFIKPPV
jgi:hypothetical protein